MRKTGIEIEFADVNIFNKKICKEIFVNLKLPCNEKNNDLYNQWIVKDDPTCGFEINTPIIYSNNDFYNLKIVLKEIKKTYKEEEIINKDCGLHVHIDISNFVNVKQFLYLLQITKILENTIIFKITNKTRIRNKYCKKICYYSKVKQCLNNDLKKFSKNINKLPKNSGLSIKSYSTLGTAEFRYYQSTLNYYEIINWINFLQKIIDFIFDKNNIKWLDNNYYKIMNKTKKISHKKIFKILKLNRETINFIQKKVKENVRNVLCKKK